MPTLLRALKIDELSLVDRPANKQAHVSIFKKAAEPNANRGEEQRMKFKTFQDAAESIRKRDCCSRTEAMSAARQLYPDLYERYQQEGIEQAEKVRKGAPIGKPAAVIKFERLIREIRSRDQCTLTEAMQTARRQHPDAFHAHQAA